MILPIVAYGASILREKCAKISPDYPNLRDLVENMWETLYQASGCGLAAPQVNVPLRLFMIDSKAAYEAMPETDSSQLFDGDTGIKRVFVNPEIVESSTHHSWVAEEGCLSIPGLSGMVTRPWQITVSYCDLDFQPQFARFSGLTARMIQHEYDHLEGLLYLDHLSSFKRELLSRQLSRIAEGRSRAAYPMVFARG